MVQHGCSRADRKLLTVTGDARGGPQRASAQAEASQQQQAGGASQPGVLLQQVEALLQVGAARASEGD